MTSVIMTTENKLREAGWFNKKTEPGYFTKTIINTRAVIALDNIKRVEDPDEICEFDVWWCGVPTPYELNLLEDEIKKLEVTQ